MAGSSVAVSRTSPRTGVPGPRYLAGFLVMAATSWPDRSKAAHSRRPTNPDAPATSTFIGLPRAFPGRARLRGRAGPPVTRTLLAYPRARLLHRPAAGDHRPARPEPNAPSPRSSLLARGRRARPSLTQRARDAQTERVTGGVGIHPEVITRRDIELRRASRQHPGLSRVHIVDEEVQVHLHRRRRVGPRRRLVAGRGLEIDIPARASDRRPVRIGGSDRAAGNLRIERGQLPGVWAFERDRAELDRIRHASQYPGRL